MFDFATIILQLLLISSHNLNIGNTWTYIVEPENTLRIIEIVDTKDIDGEIYYKINDNGIESDSIYVLKKSAYMIIKEAEHLDSKGEKFPLISTDPIPFFFSPEIKFLTKNSKYVDIINPAGHFKNCLQFDIYTKFESNEDYECTVTYKNGIGVLKIENLIWRGEKISLNLSSYHVQKSILAILDFEEIGVSENMGKIAAEMIRSDFINQNNYIIVERGKIKNLLEEYKLQQSGLIDQGQAKQFGKLLGAEELLVGSVTKLDDKFFINMRFINVTTGLSHNARSIYVNKLDELLNGSIF